MIVIAQLLLVLDMHISLSRCVPGLHCLPVPVQPVGPTSVQSMAFAMLNAESLPSGLHHSPAQLADLQRECCMRGRAARLHVWLHASRCTERARLSDLSLTERFDRSDPSAAPAKHLSLRQIKLKLPIAPADLSPPSTARRPLTSCCSSSVGAPPSMQGRWARTPTPSLTTLRRWVWSRSLRGLIPPPGVFQANSKAMHVRLASPGSVAQDLRGPILPLGVG